MTAESWRIFVRESLAREDWSSESKKRLERADLSAKYESEARERSFKQDLMADEGEALCDSDAFEKVCSEHALAGKEIDHSRLPPALARVMSLRAWRRAVSADGGSDLGAAARGALTGGTGRIDLIGSPPEGKWRSAADLVEPDLRFRPGRSGRRCVFAQVGCKDPDPKDRETPECEFLDKGRLFRDCVPDHSESRRASLADALVWLSAGNRRERGKQMVLVYYRNNADVQVRFPVPPDGAENDRFRPVPKKADVPFGKTLPEGVPESEHLTSELSVWEVVHENAMVPVQDTWLFGLGKIKVFLKRSAITSLGVGGSIAKGASSAAVHPERDCRGARGDFG